MQVYSVLCFEKVLASFKTEADAHLVCNSLHAITGLPCTVEKTTVDGNFVFKTSASKAVVDFLNLVSKSERRKVPRN